MSLKPALGVNNYVKDIMARVEEKVTNLKQFELKQNNGPQMQKVSKLSLYFDNKENKLLNESNERCRSSSHIDLKKTKTVAAKYGSP